VTGHPWVRHNGRRPGVSPSGRPVVTNQGMVVVVGGERATAGGQDAGMPVKAISEMATSGYFVDG
jgi:hypothetical protein